MSEKMNRWALTHPLSVKEYEKLKKKQMKPDFLDMVPWYSGYVRIRKVSLFQFFLNFISCKGVLKVVLNVWLNLLNDAEHLLIYSRLFLTSWYQ